MQSFDVVISGAGAVGATLALALSSLPNPPRILLIEAGSSKADGAVPVFDSRRLALSRTSIRFLQNLELWPQLASLAVSIEEIVVWQAHCAGRARISAHEEKVSELGVAVTASDFGKVLVRQAKMLSNVHWQEQARITHLQRVASGWQLALELADANAKHVQVAAQFLVVAEGAQSSTRERLGILVDQHDYQQQACVVPCRIKSSEQGIAYECFTEHGSLAVLPGVDDTRWLVWALPNSEAQQLCAMPKQLRSKTQSVLGRWLQVGELLSAPAQYSLHEVIAREQVRPHLVVLGNAAHSVHPIAGQGFNLAVRDIALLVDAICSRQQLGLEVWQAFDWLQSYAEQRRQDQQRIQRLCHGLVKGFGIQGSVATVARSLGLWAFDGWPQAKRQLAQKWLAPWSATQFQC